MYRRLKPKRTELVFSLFMPVFISAAADCLTLFVNDSKIEP
jgi:hypothetical protein